MSSCTEIKKIDVHQLLFLGGIKYCRCVMGVKHHFKCTSNFNDIVTISFIGGGNRSAQRKLLTFFKALPKFYQIMLY